MAKPKITPFTPSSPALKPLADKYEVLRAAKRKAAEDSRWGLWDEEDRRMREIRVKMTQVVGQRLVQLGKIPRSKRNQLVIRFVTTPWGQSWWEWFIPVTYTSPPVPEGAL